MPNYQKVLGGRPLVFLFGGKADPSDLYVAVALLLPREVQGYAYICVWLCVYTFIYIFMHAAPRQCYTALQTILLSGLSLSRSLALSLSRSLYDLAHGCCNSIGAMPKHLAAVVLGPKRTALRAATKKAIGVEPYITSMNKQQLPGGLIDAASAYGTGGGA